MNIIENRRKSQITVRIVKMPFSFAVSLHQKSHTPNNCLRCGCNHVAKVRGETPANAASSAFDIARMGKDDTTFPDLTVC